MINCFITNGNDSVLSVFIRPISLQSDACFHRIICQPRISPGNKEQIQPVLTIIQIRSVRSHQAWMKKGIALLFQWSLHVWTSARLVVSPVVCCHVRRLASRAVSFHSLRRHRSQPASFGFSFLFKSPSIVGHCFCKPKVMQLLACCLAMQLKRY